MPLVRFVITPLAGLERDGVTLDMPALPVVDQVLTLQPGLTVRVTRVDLVDRSLAGGLDATAVTVELPA